MSLDNDLQQRLGGLVATPDGDAAWTSVKIRVARHRRRRRGLVAGATALAVVGVVVGTVLAGGVATGDQARLAARTSTTTVATTPQQGSEPASTRPSVPGTTAGATGPVGSTGPVGGSPSTTPSTSPPATTGAPSTLAGGSPLGAAPDLAAGGSSPAGLPGSSGGSSVTVPGSGTAPPSVTVPSTGVPSVSSPPVTGAPVTSIPSGVDPAAVPVQGVNEVEAAVKQLLNSDASMVRSVSQTLGSDGQSVVAVSLRADGADLAQQIQQQWPNQVLVRVGFFLYGPAVDATANGCSSAPSSINGSGTLTASAALSPARVQSGSDFRGSLTVTNHGSNWVDFDTGLSSAVTLLAPGTSTVVGCYDGPLSHYRLSGSIAPGHSANFSFVGGTASIDRSLGYALPRGTYTGLVTIPLGNGNVAQFTFPVPIIG